MRRVMLAAAVAALLVMASAGAALAGEWNPGHFNAPGGDLPAKYNGNSECLFSGRDEPDESFLGAGDGEPFFEPAPGVIIGDDGIWASAPAKGKVQSPGQANLAGIAEPGTPGVACNGHLNPYK